jgi:hypothetical protein
VFFVVNNYSLGNPTPYFQRIQPKSFHFLLSFSANSPPLFFPLPANVPRLNTPYFYPLLPYPWCGPPGWNVMACAGTQGFGGLTPIRHRFSEWAGSGLICDEGEGLKRAVDAVSVWG